MQPFRIALCQCHSEIGSPDIDPRVVNLRSLWDWAHQAKAAGADLAVFGELYLTGYRTDNAMYRYVLAPESTDPWVNKLVELSRTLDLWLLLGTASVGDSFAMNMYNSAFLISPSGLAGVYNKTHIGTFVIDDHTLATEGCFYSAGREINVHDTRFGRLGIQICYDIHFPEVSRVLAVKGAEVIINVSAAATGFERFWDTLLPVRAEENQCWYVMGSVVGKQKDGHFFGGSRVADPTGRVVARAPDGEEHLLIADLCPRKLSEARLRSHRFSARRPELYTALIEPQR